MPGPATGVTEMLDTYVQEDRSTAEHLAGILLRHDLRQPLAAVTMLASALTALDGLPPDAMSGLLLIQQHADQMRQILRGSVEEESDVRVVDLADSLSACSERLPWAPYRVEVDRMDRAPVLVDPVGLQRATRNLLENAKRAVAGGGVVQVGVRADAGEAEFSVADSGPGFGKLPPEHGHGLVGVRRFAARFGGHLSCDSSSLGGALVTLRLPLAVGW